MKPGTTKRTAMVVDSYKLPKNHRALWGKDTWWLRATGPGGFISGDAGADMVSTAGVRAVLTGAKEPFVELDQELYVRVGYLAQLSPESAVKLAEVVRYLEAARAKAESGPGPQIGIAE